MTLFVDAQRDAPVLERAAAELAAMAAGPDLSAVPPGVDVNTLPKEQQKALIRAEMEAQRRRRAVPGGG